MRTQTFQPDTAEAFFRPESGRLRQLTFLGVLAGTEGLSPQTRVKIAFEALDSRAAQCGGMDYEGEGFRRALDDFLRSLVAALPVADVIRGLAGICIDTDGYPTDEGEFYFRLKWAADFPEPGEGAFRGETPRAIVQRNRKRGVEAIERLIAGFLGERRQEERAHLQPLDLSGPAPQPEFLVRHILGARQPCVLGGPYKCLKSSIALDLAVSLASGSPFLTQFAVPGPRRVALFNGESGADTLSRVVRNICTSKRVEVPPRPSLFVLPDLPSPAALAEWLRDHPVDVVILDPVYRLFGGEQASNLFVMGRQFSEVCSTCLVAGATPILVHHTVESLAPGRLPDLSNLAFAGAKQFARQWFLVNRRHRYRPDRPNHHRLWCVAGGAGGHGEVFGLEVDEGVDRQHWQVRFLTLDEARQEGKDKAAQGGSNRKGNPEAKLAERKQRLLQALDELGVPPGQPVKLWTLRNKARLNKEAAEPAVAALVADGILEERGKDLIRGR
jgi:hypothetical protein